MRWAPDSRRPKGGYHICAVKQREYQRKWARKRYHEDPIHREDKLAEQRRRYDNDPIYRISKRLTDDARERGKSLRKLEREVRLGSLQTEG